MPEPVGPAEAALLAFYAAQSARRAQVWRAYDAETDEGKRAALLRGLPSYAAPRELRDAALREWGDVR